MGVQEDPGRAAETRPPGQRVHHPPCPEGAEDPSGTATEHGHDVAEVPAHPGSHDARHRLLPRRLRGDPAAAVLPVRHGDRQPVRARPRDHRQPGRAVDHTADPQPADGSRGPRRMLPVPDPRPGRSVHRIVRRGPGRRRHRSREDPPQSPRANAYAERFVLTARKEVTDQMLIFGQRHLRTILAQYASHYNGRRPHRSLSLHPPAPATLSPTSPSIGSNADLSSAASSTSTSEPHRNPGQD
jgi:hypothetical protein